MPSELPQYRQRSQAPSHALTVSGGFVSMSPNMNGRLGERLKELRAERGWTQRDLALRSGVKRGYLASVEAGLVENPSVPVFLKLAGALGVPVEGLYEAAGYVKASQVSPRYLETPDDMLDHLKTVQPAAIPLCRWDDFPSRAGQAPVPFDYLYRSRRRALGRKMEAYVVHAAHYEPTISENDVIVVDREAPMQEGEVIACRVDGVPTVGKLVKTSGELYLDAADGQTKFGDCQAPATIIEVRRWLSERDRARPRHQSA